MADRLRARELFNELGERLELRWLAGQRGDARVIERGEHLSRRPSLAASNPMMRPVDSSCMMMSPYGLS